MKQSSDIKISFLLFMGLYLISGCQLDDTACSSSDPALTLHAEQNLSLITLSWDPVNVTGFKEYIILQSTTEIPNTPTPEVNTETTILKRIDNREIHSVSVSNTLFAERLCYKLYTSVNDRFLYSSTICLDQDFTLFNGFNDRVGHEDGLEKLVMFDRISSRLSIVDYITETIDVTKDDNNLSFPIIEVSTFQGTTHVFSYDQSPARLFKYKFPELTTVSNKDFGTVLFSAVIHDQYIFVSVDDFGKNFQVLNRNNFNIIDFRTGTTGNRNIAVFDGDPLIVIEISESIMWKYTIDQTGKILTSEQLFNGVSQLSTQNTTASNGTYFIGGRLGDIINKEGEHVGFITSGINSINLMNRFSPDQKKVVSIVSNNVKNTLDISDVSALPLLSKIESYDLPQATYSDVIVEDNIIYVIGVTFKSGLSQTFILKYPI